MVNPEEAQKILTAHFEQITLDEFTELRGRYVHEPSAALVPVDGALEPCDTILYRPQSAQFELEAYLASALTSLEVAEREHVDKVSDIAAMVCADLGINLYQPRNVTDPVNNPHASSEDVFNLDRERVLGSDLVIHIADYASTGSGEELDFALNALIPIVLIAHGESKVSRMVTGIPGFKLTIKYGDLTELESQLREGLTEIRPVLAERKLAFSRFDKNIVGNKIRSLREDQRLTREQVASQIDDLLSVQRIAQIEESLDSVSNPTLVELRCLAVILKTTVAELVEPDLGEHVIKVVKDLMMGNVAARYGVSSKDQRAMVSSMLHRLLVALDNS